MRPSDLLGRTLSWRALTPDFVRWLGRSVRAGAEAEVRGADGVAATFVGRARVAKPALIDGAAGAVWAKGGQPRVVFEFRIVGNKIVGIDLVANPDVLRQMDLAIL